MSYDKMIFELSAKGRKAIDFPKLDIDFAFEDSLVPKEYLREKSANLPEVSQLDAVRHYTNLSKKNYSLDAGFYPLGSCTMKYNPKINEEIAANEKFSGVHPLSPVETVQGELEVMYNLATMLSEITGMDEFTLQPAAGAHGEWTGLMLIKAYHMHRGDEKRTKIIVPDSAHGTNPASANVAGFEVIELETNADGSIDIEKLKAVLSDEIAGFMLTNPSTLGFFETQIEEVASLVHASGGLLYYDGANMNAIMGIVRPGDMGFDVCHLNLHKTFSTPHGSGGPGSGPVGVKKHLAEFLPVPKVEKVDDKYILNYDKKDSIGSIKSFYGNFGILLRAYVYILSMGEDGLRAVSENAVINANYMRQMLKDDYQLAVDKLCKHEAIFAGIKDKSTGVTTLEIAKRIIDYGFHPPTVYFPLIVDSAIMIEPTETESKQTMDEFINAMKQIAKEAKENPEIFKTSPHHSPAGRIDEALAARRPVLTYKPSL